MLTGAPGACTGNAIQLQQSKFITIRGLTITGTGGQAISLLGGNNQNRDIQYFPANAILLEERVSG